MEFSVDYAKAVNPLKINGDRIEFVESAEHVGMLRSTGGNHNTIFARITAHKRAVGAVLHVGLARGHRGNPSASFHIHQLYGAPVSMSGLAPLVLSTSEIGIIEQHFKETIQRPQRLYPNTPRPVTYFLAGILPGTAHLHLRQLSLYGMIIRLHNMSLARRQSRISHGDNKLATFINCIVFHIHFTY